MSACHSNKRFLNSNDLFLLLSFETADLQSYWGNFLATCQLCCSSCSCLFLIYKTRFLLVSCSVVLSARIGFLNSYVLTELDNLAKILSFWHVSCHFRIPLTQIINKLFWSLERLSVYFNIAVLRILTPRNCCEFFSSFLVLHYFCFSCLRVFLP